MFENYLGFSIIDYEDVLIMYDYVFPLLRGKTC